MLERHADACQELLDGKGLGDVVVRPGVEARHLVHHGIACGQQDDRGVLLTAQAAQDLHAVELRQQHVEEDQVIVGREGRLHARAPVRSLVDLVALVTELELDKARDLLFVLYDQDPSHCR